MHDLTMTIEDLGFDAFFAAQRDKFGWADFIVARVIAEQRGSYTVKNAEGEYLAKITGKQLFHAASREDFPAVGDWVAIEITGDQAVIKGILPRRSILKRTFGDKNRAGEKKDVQVIAANIDVVFVVESVGRDFNLNRFERFLVIARDAGITPVFVLNKIDLITQEEQSSLFAQIKSRFPDIEMIATSTLTNHGIDELLTRIEKGKTYSLLGSSGVGKSSLINALRENETVRTGDISDYSKRGKHVTTSRQMYFLPARRSPRLAEANGEAQVGVGGEQGGMVIDNPGIREVGMTDPVQGMDDVFETITALASECAYADCSHTHEPGCAVQEAVQTGTLDQAVYDNYVTLQKETEHYAMSETDKRAKDRSFGKFLKNAKRDFKKYKLKDF